MRRGAGGLCCSDPAAVQASMPHTRPPAGAGVQQLQPRSGAGGGRGGCRCRLVRCGPVFCCTALTLDAGCIGNSAAALHCPHVGNDLWHDSCMHASLGRRLTPPCSLAPSCTPAHPPCLPMDQTTSCRWCSAPTTWRWLRRCPAPACLPTAGASQPRPPEGATIALTNMPS